MKHPLPKNLFNCCATHGKFYLEVPTRMQNQPIIVATVQISRSVHSKWALVRDTAMSHYYPTPNPVRFSRACSYVIGIENYGVTPTFFKGWLVSEQISLICPLPRLLQHHFFIAFLNPGKTPLSPTRSRLLWVHPCHYQTILSIQFTGNSFK